MDSGKTEALPSPLNGSKQKLLPEYEAEQSGLQNQMVLLRGDVEAADPHSKVKRTQQIDIYYKGIGTLEMSKIYATRQE